MVLSGLRLWLKEHWPCDIWLDAPVHCGICQFSSESNVDYRLDGTVADLMYSFIVPYRLGGMSTSSFRSGPPFQAFGDMFFLDISSCAMDLRWYPKCTAHNPVHNLAL